MTLHKTVIRLEPELCWLLSILLLTVPVRWLFGWFLAVIIHELGHYIALTAFGIPVPAITFGLRGAVMQIRELSRTETVICAASGPAAGLMLLLLSRWVPIVSVFGFLQSIYNLLPIPGHDGDRVLWGVCHLLFYGERAEALHIAIRNMIFLIASGVLLYLIAG